MIVSGSSVMRVCTRTFLSLIVPALGAWVAPSVGHADPLDLALNRLSYYNDTPWQGNSVNYDPTRFRFRGGCGTTATASGGQAYAQCFPDNQLWANLVNELGGALAPGLAAPAMTLGYAGVYIGYELSFSNLAQSDHWGRGTEGSTSTNVGSGTETIRDRYGDPVAFVSRLHVRKGFPFGFELGTQVNHLHSSGMWAIGLDLRWAPFEGFRRGIGYLPDFAVRGSVNTLVGQPQLNLTVVGIDATLSKRFTLGGQVRLAPYVGGQTLLIFGNSGVVDFTPGRSAYEECPRQEIRYVTDPRPTTDPARSPSGRIGQLQCGGGGTAVAPGVPGDLNDTHNNGVFQAMRIQRWRAFGGLQFQWRIVSVTAEFGMDLAAPSFFSTPPVEAGRPTTQPAAAGTPTRVPITLNDFRQWTTTISVGLSFR